MSLETAGLIVTLLGVYAGIGLLVGLLVAAWGAARIDPAAKDMPLQARAVILPGAALLWPLMLVKLFTQTEPPVR